MINLLFAISGDCGTPYPRRFPFPGPTPPDPEPWWWISHLVAAGGGILGGTLVESIVNVSMTQPTTLLVGMAGAFAVGRVAGGIASTVLGNIGARNVAQTKVVA